MQERGLSNKEAEVQLLKYGKNEISEKQKVSVFQIFLRQIRKNFILYLLLSAVIISFIVGKSITAYTILAVIVLVIIAGFIQEYKAEKAIAALKMLVMPVSRVLRDGKEHEVLSINIVPDDIIILRTGEKIPADCFLVEEKDLYVNESILTGESAEVKKVLPKTQDNLKDENILFMGSFIVNGRCLAKAIHTGMNTKFGKIAGLISTAEKELPLQKKINKITTYMVFIALSVSLLTGLFMIFTAPTLDKEFLVNVLILTLALAVSAFPEGFPVVIITTLASGVYAMAKKNAIVNRMSIIETLGETTVICSDKTGTLTEGEMTVKKILIDHKIIEVTGGGYEAHGEFMLDNKPIDIKNNYQLSLLLKAAVLCNDSQIERTGEDEEYKIMGNPTEASLLILAAKARLFKENFNFKREEEIPFSSERKLMAVLCSDKTGSHVYTKGALEVLLSKCSYIQNNNKTFTLTNKEKSRILNINKELTSQSYRVLALAYKKSSSNNKNDLEKDLIFLGAVAIEDPPRPEVKASIRLCLNAGIKVKMITGDSKETAIAIGRQIGLSGKVLEGSEIDAITDEELPKIVDSIIIFARVKPEHKLRIVKALKQNGEIVTMTGDGVNDAPALKEAHIGIAMGKNGTDVSRSVADLTLKDDNFATIVAAIKEGRTIFNNVRKFVTYQLSCNFAELSLLFIGVLIAPLLGWQIPILLALQILFMNIVTDNLPAIALGFNKSSEDIMRDGPRKKSSILSKNLLSVLIFTGSLMTLLVLGSFYISYNVFNEDIVTSRTIALVSLIFIEIANAFNFRSFRKGVLTRSPLVNKPLFYLSLISIIATLTIIYTPLNTIFEVVPLSLNQWALPITLSLFVIVLYDLIKIMLIKTRKIDLNL
ncbi:MAG: cation-transporting P-type ATPase [Nanoarchaeota archaeon]|nr:cation-transporting P-type ATPase [Nanoarchaeota archaeon]